MFVLGGEFNMLYEIMFEGTAKDVVVSNWAALCINFFLITCWAGYLSFHLKLLHKMLHVFLLHLLLWKCYISTKR